MLTIFYDSKCPLCSTEMMHLKRYDNNDVITLVDLHQDNFNTLYPEIDFVSAMKILHGRYQGKTLLALAVTHRAWTLVGKGFWVAPLNWPIVKTLSHWVYLAVAKYRHQISAFVAKIFGIKTTKCYKGTCYDKPTDIDHWRK